MSKKKTDLLNNVDFLDRVRIHVFPGKPHPGDLYPFRVEVQSLDESKRVIFDEAALKKMNQILTEKASQFHPNDPRVRGYLEEFVGRLITELYRNGLCDLEDLPDQPDDPYEKLRKTFARN